jgi:hypothetical protein
MTAPSNDQELKPYTREEMARMLVERMFQSFDYWSKEVMVLTDPKRTPRENMQVEREMLLDGLLRNIIYVLNGGSGLPPICLVPQRWPVYEGNLHPPIDNRWPHFEVPEEVTPSSLEEAYCQIFHERKERNAQ